MAKRTPTKNGAHRSTGAEPPTRPERMSATLVAERREAKRAQVRLRVLFVSSGFIVEARTIDVSETGMCLHTSLLLEPGTAIELRFSPNSDTRAVYRIECEVRWVRVHDKSTEAYHCGIRFLSIPTPARQALRQIVDTETLDASVEDIPEVSMSDVIEVTDQPPDIASELAQAVAADKSSRTEGIVLAHKAVEMGRAAAKQGDIESAVAAFEQALEHHPDSHDALEELGQLMYTTGDVVRAAALFDRALRARQEK